jgi:N-acetyltransferase 10
MDSIKGVRLSPVQAAIICGVGLQNKSITDLETELGLPSSQILALFGKSVRKCVAYLDAVIEMDATAEMEVKSEASAVTRVGRDVRDESEWDPTAVGLNEDLEEGGEGVMKELKERQEAVMSNWDMSRYVIEGEQEDWEKVKKVGGIVNIPSGKKRKGDSTGVAKGLADEYHGEKTGIVDPSLRLGTKKSGGKSRKRKS